MFLIDYMGMKINEWDLQVCHPVAAFQKYQSPPNVIVRCIHFHFLTKDTICSR